MLDKLGRNTCRFQIVIVNVQAYQFTASDALSILDVEMIMEKHVIQV